MVIEAVEFLVVMELGLVRELPVVVGTNVGVLSEGLLVEISVGQSVAGLNVGQDVKQVTGLLVELPSGQSVTGSNVGQVVSEVDVVHWHGGQFDPDVVDIDVVIGPFVVDCSPVGVGQLQLCSVVSGQDTGFVVGSFVGQGVQLCSVVAGQDTVVGSIVEVEAVVVSMAGSSMATTTVPFRDASFF